MKLIVYNNNNPNLFILNKIIYDEILSTPNNKYHLLNNMFNIYHVNNTLYNPTFSFLSFINISN